MAEYAFDVILRAALRVPDMPDEATARAELAAMLDAAYSNFGLWSNGEPILGEASIADDIAKPRLFEVDGVDVAPGSYFQPIGQKEVAALKVAATRALCVLEGVATIRQPGDTIAELARVLALFSEPESAPANPRHAEITLSLRAKADSDARDIAAIPSADDVARAVLVIDGNEELSDWVREFLNREDTRADDVDRVRGTCRAIMEEAELAIPSAEALKASRMNDAAGDMLAALEEALEVMGDWGNDGEPAWAGRARAAITRAKGE